MRNIKSYLYKIIKSPFYYLILVCFFITGYFSELENNKLLRWGQFNERLEEMNILIPNNDGTFNWLSEEQIFNVIGKYPKIKEDKIIEGLLKKYPINENGFIDKFESSVSRIMGVFLLPIPLLIIIVLALSSVSFLNKNWDFEKTINRTLIILSIISLISISGQFL